MDSAAPVTSENRSLGAHTLVVIPTYNERDNIAVLLPSIRETVPDADILVVDDNSPDGTAAVVETMRERDQRLHLLLRSGKDGYGKAVTAGLLWALDRDYKHIVQMDADLSHDPRFIPDLIDGLRAADLVVGSRYIPGGGTRNWSLGRRLLSRAGNAYARSVLGLHVRDVTSGFRCWRRQLVESIEIDTVKASGYSFMIESIYRAVHKGARVVEVPILFVDRTAGKSKMSKRIISEALFIVWNVRSAVGRNRRSHS